MKINKALLFIIGAVIIFAGLFFIVRKSPTPKKIPAPVKKEFTLPKKWSYSKDIPANAILKITRQTTRQIIPTIVLIKSQTAETDYKNYVDQLVKGAEATIPDYNLVNDREINKPGFYARQIISYYYKGNQKVDAVQQIFIRYSTVYTLTCSTDPHDTGALKNETDPLLQSVQDFFIK